MSDDLYARAASTDKTFHVIEGANHMQMYDGEPQINEAIGQLAPFFQKNLGA